MPGAGPAQPAPAPPAQQEQEITLAYPSPSLSWLPIRVAEQKGFFAEEGLHPRFFQTVSANIVADLVTGEVDFGLDTNTSAQAVVQQQVPVRNLMAIAVKPQHRLMVQPDIRTFADLKGKTIAVNQRLDLTEWETRVILERNGVLPEESNMLPIPSSPSRLAALASGQVAGAIMASPFDLRAEAQGQYELGRLSRDIDIVWMGLSASERTLAERPELVVRTLRASLRGLEYTRANRADAERILQESLGIDPEEAAAAYTLGLETWSADGTASDAAWLNMHEVSRLAGPVPANLAIDQFLVRQPLEEARRSLPSPR